MANERYIGAGGWTTEAPQSRRPTIQGVVRVRGGGYGRSRVSLEQRDYGATKPPEVVRTRTSPGEGYANLKMCCLAMEDDPVGDDSKLYFESFPEELSETYTATWKAMEDKRKSQPRYALWQQGDWTSFTLELTFHVGMDGEARPGGGPAYLMSVVGGAAGDEAAAIARDQMVEDMLIEMEDKVRWCQALSFPISLRSRMLLGGGGDGGSSRVGDSGSMFSGARLDFGVDLNTLNRGANGAGHFGAGDSYTATIEGYGPPVVLVQLGSWQTLRGYVEGTTINWQRPWHSVSARPYGAKVQLTIHPMRAVGMVGNIHEYPDWQSVREWARKQGRTYQSLGE